MFSNYEEQLKIISYKSCSKEDVVRGCQTLTMLCVMDVTTGKVYTKLDKEIYNSHSIFIKFHPQKELKVDIYTRVLAKEAIGII